jgi:uncharacterized repeat protein (TIGR02543 family)
MKRIFLALLILFAGVAIFTSIEVSAAPVETEIQAVAHYKFEDAENPGKDYTGHGFDLSKAVTSSNPEALQILVDPVDNESYLSIRRDQYTTGMSKGFGAYLYAPQQGKTSKDFSDMIVGSYTISFTFRADNTIPFGDVYVLSFGRYNSCYTIVPWKNGFEVQLRNIEFAEGATDAEKQSYMESSVGFYPYSTSDWTNITVTANAIDNKHTLYLNGEVIDEVVLAGTKLTSSGVDDYTFCIGAQCNIYGASATQFANVDVKDLQIYDCALSAENVGRIINGSKAVLEQEPEGTEYVISLETLDPASIDLEVTDVNTLDVILASLPEKIKVNTSDGLDRKYNVYWYEGANQKIKGYVQCGYINPEFKVIDLKYDYVAKFEYDSNLVEVKNVKLNGVNYVPGTPISPNKQTLTFEVALKGGATLDGVYYFDMEWEVEEGIYYIDIVEGALISINATGSASTVTYKDGTKTLGTSEYTAGGSEELRTFTKEGYTFEGWYLDEALTQKFTELDYTNPVDITLYAKWTANATTDPGTDPGKEDPVSKKGCKGSIAASIIGLSLVLGTVAFIRKRKNK